MTSRFVYDIDCSRSTWRLCLDGVQPPDRAYALHELAGDFVFKPGDLDVCRIQLRTAIVARGAKSEVLKTEAENVANSSSNGARAIRFLSWRFREIGPRKYWVAGALTIGDLSTVASLRIDGPTPEISDRNGYVRAGAIAATRIEGSPIRLALDQSTYSKTSTPARLLTLTFQIELVRRLPDVWMEAIA